MKRLITGMAVAMLLVIGWGKLVQYLAVQHPEWHWADAPTTLPTTEQAIEANNPTTGMVLPGNTTATTQSTQSTQSIAGLTVSPATRPASAVIGSDTPNDPNVTMGVTVVPHGAGLQEVVLNDFKQTVESQDRYVYQTPYGGPADDDTRSLATRSITIDGQEINLLNIDWEQVHATVASTTYRAVVKRDGAPAVQIDKTYTLTPRGTDEKTPQGYEIVLATKVTNLTAKPIVAKLTMNGPTCPVKENDRYDDRLVIGGYSHEGFSAFSHTALTELSREKPTKDLSKDTDGLPLLWIGESSVYFNAIVRPDLSQPIKITAATAIGMNNNDPTDQHVLLKLETDPFTVAPGASADSVNNVFFGPKQRHLLNSTYYSAPQLKYDDTLVIKSSFFICAWLTMTPVINALYFLLATFHLVLRDWGLAIICLVFLVRACLHPITKRAQLNMAKMGKMGPEIERLKKKHGDNKDELNKAMMQFYKTQGATPILGCLPMFLQMPIWLALYASLQSTFELRQSPFLWGFTWIHDLAHPDRLFYFPTHPLAFWVFHIDAINILPVILGVVSFMQAKITQAQQPPPATPEAAQQQKIMPYMTLMLPVILYNGPSGLNLYIMTSSIFGIIESKIVRRHIKEREALEKAGVVIVDKKADDDDDRPPTGTVRRKGPKDPEPKKGGFMSWIGELQRKAEEMAKEQQNMKNKKK